MYSMKLGTLIMYMVISCVVGGASVLVIEKFVIEKFTETEEFKNTRPIINTPSKGY